MIKMIINNLFYIKLDYNYLITCNLFEILNLKLLMTSWLNTNSFYLSIFKIYGLYFSRKKINIWFKGKSSKNFQILKKFYIDCDMDIINYYFLQLNKICCHNNNLFCNLNKCVN